MPFYIIRLPERSGATLADGVDMAVVHAVNGDDARRIAASAVKGDPSSMWDTATAEEIQIPGNSWGDWMFNVGLIPPLGQQGGFNLMIEGGTTEQIGTVISSKIVPALIAQGLTASWASPILTFATVGNGKGRSKILFDIYPPAAFYVDPRPCNGIITEIVDQNGTDSVALTVAFNVAATMPILYRLGRKV